MGKLVTHLWMIALISVLLTTLSKTRLKPTGGENY